MKLDTGRTDPRRNPSRQRAWLLLRFEIAFIFHRSSTAQRLLQQLRDKFGDYDLHDAYYGRLLLEAGQPAEARQAYQDVFVRSRTRGDGNGEFLRWLAEAWINSIDGESLKAERCFAKAKSIDVGRSLQRANPGPIVDRPDPTDEEFESWMKRNHPNG